MAASSEGLEKKPGIETETGPKLGQNKSKLTEKKRKEYIIKIRDKLTEELGKKNTNESNKATTKINTNQNLTLLDCLKIDNKFFRGANIRNIMDSDDLNQLLIEKAEKAKLKVKQEAVKQEAKEAEFKVEKIRTELIKRLRNERTVIDTNTALAAARYIEENENLTLVDYLKIEKQFFEFPKVIYNALDRKEFRAIKKTPKYKEYQEPIWEVAKTILPEIYNERYKYSLNDLLKKALDSKKPEAMNLANDLKKNAIKYKMDLNDLLNTLLASNKPDDRALSKDLILGNHVTKFHDKHLLTAIQNNNHPLINLLCEKNRKFYKNDLYTTYKSGMINPHTTSRTFGQKAKGAVGGFFGGLFAGFLYVFASPWYVLIGAKGGESDQLGREGISVLGSILSAMCMIIPTVAMAVITSPLAPIIFIVVGAAAGLAVVLGFITGVKGAIRGAKTGNGTEGFKSGWDHVMCEGGPNLFSPISDINTEKQEFASDQRVLFAAQERAEKIQNTPKKDQQDKSAELSSSDPASSKEGEPEKLNNKKNTGSKQEDTDDDNDKMKKMVSPSPPPPPVMLGKNNPNKNSHETTLEDDEPEEIPPPPPSDEEDEEDEEEENHHTSVP